MDLSAKYMGLDLKNPIVPSASPLSESLDRMKALEDAGASAVVMFSIFEEQVKQEAATLEEGLSAGADSFAESLSYFPRVDDYRVGPEKYIELLNAASETLSIPIIGSLNGISNEGWIDYARQIESAGAKGLELNVYYIPGDPDIPGTIIEQTYIDILKAVKAAVSIPVAIKLNPFFSAMANMAKQLDDAGADALVLFNRFYQPDFDLETMSVTPSLKLSVPEEARLPLRWIAILSGQIKASLAATTGVHRGLDAAKYILAGADVVMTTSALLQQGVGHIATLLKELEEFMERKEYASVEQMKGAMSQTSVADPTAFERGNYIRIIEKYKAEYTMS